MKIQIDLPDTELWARFKDEVTRQGKTLREVVPTVFEPALRWFLREPPLTTQPVTEETKQAIIEASNKGFPLLDSPHKGKFVEEIESERAPNSNEFPEHLDIPRTPQVKRCDLCDMPTERTFNHKGRKVCYTCWRDGIINEGTKVEPEVKP